MIVDEQHLHVRHRRLIFEDPHAAPQQLAVQPPARDTDPFLIRPRSRHDDRDLDPASGDLDERAAERTVGQEVGCRDPHVSDRSLDQHLEDDARDGGAIGW